MPEDQLGLELYCPKCQYSLRGLSGNRCPECGSEFDLSTLGRSRVPWYQRQEIGRVRAWWKTCWMAAFGTRELALSLNAPAPYADARKFWLIHVVVLSLPLCVVAWSVPVELPGTRSLTMLGLSTPQTDPWLSHNVLIPIQGALCFRPVVAACAVLSVVLLTGVVSYLFQVMPLPRRLQDRAAALSLFSCGSLISGGVVVIGVSLALGVLWLAVAAAREDLGNVVDRARSSALDVVLGMVGAVILAWWVSLGLLYRRMCSATLLRRAGVLAAMLLLGCTIGLFCFVILPWCIGMSRIMLSFP